MSRPFKNRIPRYPLRVIARLGAVLPPLHPPPPAMTEKRKSVEETKSFSPCDVVLHDNSRIIFD